MDRGSNDKLSKVEQVVTSGNSWIIRRSKTHSGRIYYFNTLTGEAVWNLSDAEIEKAKRTTNNLPNHAGLDGCPEPKDPPMDNPKDAVDLNRRRLSEPSRIYNKQIINNKFPNQGYDQPIIIPPYSLISNPINSLLPIGIDGQTNNFNRNMWAMPPTHQIYIAPTVPMYNKPQPSFHVGYRRQEISEQNAPPSHPERFQHMRNKTFTTPHRHFERNNFGQRNDNNFMQRKLNNSRNSFNSNDLRAFLTAKKRQRSLSQSQNKDSEVTHIKKDDGDGQNTQKPAEASQCDLSDSQNEKDEHRDADSDWLEDNILFEGGQLKLDVTNLKKLAKPNTDPACWYIAADKDILLNHLNFLNILCQSDDVCHLMVPEKVEEELREAAEEDDTRMSKRASRACTFLLQQQDAGFVVIGKGTCDVDNTRSQYLINCCNNLSERNFHVILLSNENELKSLKNTSNVPIFTINELKEFITKPFIEQDVTKVKSHTSTNVQTPIKITIQNDLNVSDTTDPGIIDTGITDKANHEGQVRETLPKVVVAETKLTDSENSGQSVKCIAEIGTQTDFRDSDGPCPTAQPSVTTDCAVNFEKPKEFSHVQAISDPEKPKEFNTKSRRQIRLNRNTSNKNSVGNEDNTEKNKQFKWRKRRNVLSTQTDDAKLSSSKSCDITNISKEPAKNTDNIEVTNANHQTVQILQQDKSNESIRKRTNDDNADDSETSSIVHRNITNDRVVIEETSTSGVISNTVSTIDSESESERRFVLDHSFNDRNRTDTSEIVMYEVKDKKMEDYLKNKYDEWISRFIQIMEEVLTQVLQQNKRFLSNVVYKQYGGGPWPVRDAAECVKIKFRRYHNVVDAANKLINIFIQISDDTGRITTNLCPSKYMEMYSYGVNTVDALQSVCDCEDLEIASQSLHKLLNDIQNPHLDSSHNDTFPDNIQESTGEVKEVSEPQSKGDLIQENPASDCVEKSNENVKKYNLRSRSKHSQDNADKQDSFFTSLNLKKRRNSLNNTSIDENLSTSQNVPNNTNETIKELENDTNIEETRVKSATSSYVNHNTDCNRVPLDLDELDYSAYCDKDDNSDKLSDRSRFDEPDEIEVKDETELYNGDEINSDMQLSDITNNNLNILCDKVIREVKEAMIDVHTFCVNIHKELCDSEFLNRRKIEMLREAEEAQILIDKLCGSLTSVFDRETYLPQNNIQSLLKQAGGIDSSLNCTQLYDYRDSIAKCLNQAKILQKSVALIFTVVKNKPAKVGP